MSQDGQLLRVLADHQHSIAQPREHLRTQIAEPTIAEHDDSVGTLGVVLNRPTELRVGEAIPGWEDEVCAPGVLFNGGPVAEGSALALATRRDGGQADDTTRQVPGLTGLFADLAIVDIDPATAADAAEEIRGIGRRSISLSANVADGASVARMTADAIAGLGRIDILVNNAATGVVNVALLDDDPRSGGRSFSRFGTASSCSCSTRCAGAPLTVTRSRRGASPDTWIRKPSSVCVPCLRFKTAP